MPISEVARLRARIEVECQALQTLTLFSCSASHQIIEAKYRNLERHHTQLKTLVGEEQATSAVVDIYKSKRF